MISLEERALIAADKYFSTKDKWWPGRHRSIEAQLGATCVGLFLENYRRYEGGKYKALEAEATNLGGWMWSSKVMDTPHVVAWNDKVVPSFVHMKEALRSRIRHYKGLRT